MFIPSSKQADRTLKIALTAIDDHYDAAVRALPDGHTWRDIDVLETERAQAAIKAYDEHKIAIAEWDAYVAGHADDEA